jgi:hypothetical protein
MRAGNCATAVALVLMAVSASPAQSNGEKRIVDPHEVIALEKGIWDAVITSLPPTPGATPTTSTGVQVNELRSGGMWMLNRMSVNGGAYEGTGIWGYDPKSGRYAGSWADNSYDRIRMDNGTWDPDSSTMTWTAEVERRDGSKVRIRATSAFAGETRTYRSFILTDRGEVPSSIVVFTRRTKSAIP